MMTVPSEGMGAYKDYLYRVYRMQRLNPEASIQEIKAYLALAGVEEPHPVMWRETLLVPPSQRGR